MICISQNSKDTPRGGFIIEVAGVLSNFDTVMKTRVEFDGVLFIEDRRCGYQTNFKLILKQDVDNG